MTAAKASFEELLAMAKACDCCGVELRNDLPTAFLGEMQPQDAQTLVAAHGLRILALAEVKSFNHLTAQTISQAQQLAALAQACGAQAIALIPSNDGTRTDKTVARKDLKHALTELLPILEHNDVMGFVEPLGFASSSVRRKSEVVEVINELSAHNRIKIVHDTFHHFLSDEAELFADYTGMVHVSGVAESGISVDEMQDAHRGLVTREDRLQNVEQLITLFENGYCGPVSMEAFATEVHECPKLNAQLHESFHYMLANLAAQVTADV